MIFIAVTTPAIAQQNCAPLPASYSVLDLGTLGGSSSFAFAVNNSGAVTGESLIRGDSNDHAFLWTASAGMQDLGTLGGDYSVGAAINSLGNVAGDSDLPNGTTHAFLWTAPAGMQDLGSLAGPSGFSHAYGMEDHNRVAGTSETPTNTKGDAVVWSGPAINDLGSDKPYAYAINGRYQVAVTDVKNAFVWTPTGGFWTLDSRSGTSGSIPRAINNYGMLAGYDLDDIAGLPAAVVWNGIHIRGIGTLGGRTSTAYALSDNCQAVGVSELSDLLTQHAFIWTPQSGMLDLNTLLPANSGWELLSAYGINAKGQIVGQGITHSRYHAYILTPM
jgi:probable HAF family extracellular repeat protein